MINCKKTIKHYKKEIMKILGIKKWGVINLVNVDDEKKAKVYNIMEKIEELKYEKYKLDRMREERYGIYKNVRELYKQNY